MIIVHGIIPIRPERRDRALSLAREMSEATKSEPGCISYEFYVGLSDPNTLLLFQEWESMEALTRHFQTQHMEEFLRALPAVISGDISTRRYAVQSVDEDSDGSDDPDSAPVIH
jgi:quinol monooxygenase YgiN